MKKHIVLLGDSTFDNQAYTDDEPDVISHLQDVLPARWKASLCAVDGSTAQELSAQIGRTAKRASHLIVSVGGNDALMNADILDTPVSSTAEALTLFGQRVDRFEVAYRSAIEAVLRLKAETSVCTIYNGNLDADEAALARIGLMLFNDAILRTAFEYRLDVIDLRFVCAQPSDYANPIEPSGSGGRKIALAIARRCGALEAAAPASVAID